MRFSSLNNIIKSHKAVVNYAKKNNVILTDKCLNIALACWWMDKKYKIITNTKLKLILNSWYLWYDSKTISKSLSELEKLGCLTIKIEQRRGFKTKVFKVTYNLIILLNAIERKARNTKLS